MTSTPIVDQMRQILRYTKQQPCKIKEWRMTRVQYNQLLEELNFFPHEKRHAWYNVKRGVKPKVLHIPIKIIDCDITVTIGSLRI